MNAEDQLVSVLPVHYSNTLVPNVHIHQFPLLNRPLQVPPSAALSGKRMKARIKPSVKRFEIHVPVDTRPEVWSFEKSKELGAARIEDDKEKNQDVEPIKSREEEPRLSEVRLQSEQIPPTGAYMLGVIRDGHLHLHPISEVHQLRPTLTYLDTMSRKSRRSQGGVGSDSDSDDGPPPDPDEPAPPPAPKKEKKAAGEAKEVQISARKNEERGGLAMQGSLSTVRREMLLAMRAEEDEAWQDLDYHDAEAGDSVEAYEALFSRDEQALVCKSDVTTFLKSIKGL